jgi:hypothetical protein
MKKFVDQLEETRKKINSFSFDAHWYRRVCHAFAACFLFYYMLPDVNWINILKFWVPLFILLFAVMLEILRLKGFISSEYFFGLRMYEKKRAGSYLIFVLSVLNLMSFFPQQIAIPCILCGCLADPVMGEVRYRFGKNYVYVFGFLICMIFFMVSWYNVELWVLFLISIVGASGAVLGEVKKFWWLDDDFMIQIVPAVLLIILLFALTNIGVNVSFEKIIYPGDMPW